MVLLPHFEMAGIIVVLDKSCRQFRGKVAGRISLQTKITGFGKPEPVLLFEQIAISKWQLAKAACTGLFQVRLAARYDKILLIANCYLLIAHPICRPLLK